MKQQNEQQFAKLTDKQQEIIDHVFHFRHLHLPQIQHLLNHKHKERIRTWLNDLTERHYLKRFYEKELAGKPSEYCLDIASIPYLKEKGTSERLVKRVYKEKTNSKSFRDHCEFVATFYLGLRELTKKTEATLHFYTKDDMYHTKYLIYPLPDSSITIVEKNETTARYFLDVFEDELFMYKRVYQYLNYFKKQYWQDHTSKPFPKIILVCSSEHALGRLCTFIQKKRSEDAPSFYLTTKEAIHMKGVNKQVLQKVE